jgi:hypothetical protein
VKIIMDSNCSMDRATASGSAPVVASVCRLLLSMNWTSWSPSSLIVAFMIWLAVEHPEAFED